MAAEGSVELVGPDDPAPDLSPDDLQTLLRHVHASAGAGPQDDWVEYDRTVAAERRVAVLLTAQRIYVNP